MDKQDATRLVAQGRIGTPLGTLMAAATERGLAGLWFDGQKHHPGALDAPHDDTQRFIAQARRELAVYFGGPRAAGRRFTVPLDPQGTAFQRRVWSALLSIGPGEHASYGALAARIGHAGAARAVGAAVGRNPLAIVVPCHRVLGAGGSLTGYAGGLERKRALLELEAKHAAAVNRAAA
jgi:methylated-DNA-[protein]-cysteine S-methyltransferase